MNLFELQRNANAIDIKGLFRDVLLDVSTQNMIVELQKEQLLQGKDSTGNDIEPQYRNAYYSAMKQGMNSLPVYRTPDLKLTGAFYRAIYFDTGKMNLTSSDSKTASLKEKYGEGILGLNEDSLEKLRPDYIQKVEGRFVAQLIGG